VEYESIADTRQKLLERKKRVTEYLSPPVEPPVQVPALMHSSEIPTKRVEGTTIPSAQKKRRRI
jgi:hypothetical protein